MVEKADFERWKIIVFLSQSIVLSKRFVLELINQNLHTFPRKKQFLFLVYSVFMNAMI